MLHCFRIHRIPQADQNPMYPVSNAETLRDSLVGVPGGARVFSVKCAYRNLSRLYDFTDTFYHL